MFEIDWHAGPFSLGPTPSPSPQGIYIQNYIYNGLSFGATDA